VWRVSSCRTTRTPATKTRETRRAIVSPSGSLRTAFAGRTTIFERKLFDVARPIDRPQQIDVSNRTCRSKCERRALEIRLLHPRRLRTFNAVRHACRCYESSRCLVIRYRLFRERREHASHGLQSESVLSCKISTFLTRFGSRTEDTCASAKYECSNADTFRLRVV